MPIIGFYSANWKKYFINFRKKKHFANQTLCEIHTNFNLIVPKEVIILRNLVTCFLLLCEICGQNYMIHHCTCSVCARKGVLLKLTI